MINVPEVIKYTKEKLDGLSFWVRSQPKTEQHLRRALSHLAAYPSQKCVFLGGLFVPGSKAFMDEVLADKGQLIMVKGQMEDTVVRLYDAAKEENTQRVEMYSSALTYMGFNSWLDEKLDSQSQGVLEEARTGKAAPAEVLQALMTAIGPVRMERVRNLPPCLMLPTEGKEDGDYKLKVLAIAFGGFPSESEGIYISPNRLIWSLQTHSFMSSNSLAALMNPVAEVMAERNLGYVDGGYKSVDTLRCKESVGIEQINRHRLMTFASSRIHEDNMEHVMASLFIKDGAITNTVDIFIKD